MWTDTDRHFMSSALAIARQGLGRTWPNPSVGCVLVKNGSVVARARTVDKGRPHAETVALAQAGTEAKGAEAYVTLEPCSHTGQTPPCADSLIAAGIKRCVIAARDPDQRVDGRGIERLRQAGVIVETGLMRDEALELNRGFVLTRAEGRPLVTLKIASSADGQAADRLGHSKWITGEAARQRGHLERAMHDAVMVGAGTYAQDCPQLTVRLRGSHPQPVRLVIDTNLRLSCVDDLIKTQVYAPLWIVTACKTRERIAPLEDAGAKVIQVEKDGQGHCDLGQTLRALAAAGITRLLVDGGPTLIGSFLRAGLYDRVLLFRAPDLLGDCGRAAVPDLGVPGLEGRLRLRRLSVQALGRDVLEIYAKAVEISADPA